MTYLQYTDKELEIMISNYRQLRVQLLRIRENIMVPHVITDTNTGGGSSGFLSNPTEMTAIRLAEDDGLNDIKNIGLAIENTYALLPKEKQKMMLAYFIDRDPKLKDKEIARRLYIDRTTLWRWKNQIRQIYKNELINLKKAEKK
ncbi:hypothetical protein [Carnobacterium inhibens]|uniref:hypothetical protein n=1 Tax=Carnobacterium inhibens TaxID=147709 RepID=UPI002455DC95|nr:hypothetical protein [Carnobacterium inhibens]